MKIAQIAPLIERVPPRRYGGTERVVYYLTEALVDMGHDVTLFASGDSLTTARHIAVSDTSLRTAETRRDPNIWHLHQLLNVVEMASEFDIVHFHTDYFHFPVWRNVTTPQLTTLHGRLDIPDLSIIYNEFADMSVASISNSQRRPIPDANWAGTVYNGTPSDAYSFSPDGGDYFAFLGRFSPEKGPEDAIRIAKELDTPLKMAAKIDPVDQEYFDNSVKPLLDHPLIEFIGEVDEAGKNELLGSAKALLFPIAWPEPFGLVMTEAMACGTPVVAYRNGSVDEVMLDGVTGFVVDSLEEAVEAADEVSRLDRQACRDHFDEHFTVEQMADGYMSLYEKLVEHTRTGQPGSRVLSIPRNGPSVSSDSLAASQLH